MIDPIVVDSIAKLGALGFAIIAVAAFVSGTIRVGSLVDKEQAEDDVRRDKREAELVTERNEWRSMAETSVTKLGRLTDVLEATVGKRLGE